MFINQRFTDHEQDREPDVTGAWPGFGIAVIEIKGASAPDPDWRT
jgi:hypothetical protein